MSSLLSASSQSDREDVATLSYGDTTDTQGQRKSRSPDLVGSGSATTMGDIEEMKPDVEISPGQKMLSAVSGSLLTSLLGGCS